MTHPNNSILPSANSKLLGGSYIRRSMQIAAQVAQDSTSDPFPSSPSNSTARRSRNNVERTINVEKSIEFQDLGLRLKREGNYAASKDAYRNAIRLNYIDAMAYYSLAKTCYLNGNGREAIRNYLAALHLSLGNMLQSLSNPDEAGGFIAIHNIFTAMMDAETLLAVRSAHPHAELLWLDQNTPRHLAHALVDLNPHVKKSRKLNRSIQLYKESIKSNNVVKIDNNLELKHYLQIGVTFAWENLKWSNLDILDPYSLYSTKDQLRIEGVRKLIKDLP